MSEILRRLSAMFSIVPTTWPTTGHRGPRRLALVAICELARGVGVALHRRGRLFHRRDGLLRVGPALGALRQISVAGGDLGRRDRLDAQRTRTELRSDPACSAGHLARLIAGPGPTSCDRSPPGNLLDRFHHQESTAESRR